MWRSYSVLSALILFCGASGGIPRAPRADASVPPAPSAADRESRACCSADAARECASSITLAPVADQTAPASTSPPAAQKDEDLAVEYDALAKAYRAAVDAYYAPYEKAKTDEERDKIVLDPALDPNKTFPAKFKDLAARAKGTETGLKCHLWIVKNDSQKSDADEAVEALTSEYVESPMLVELATTLRYRAWTLGIDRARSALEQLSRVSPHKEVRAQATFSLAATFMEGQGGGKSDLARAKELLLTVQHDYGDTKAAIHAEHALFQIDHLQLGMTAPDIEATDQESKPFKLADYRGKVVVLDFWGFW